MEEWRKEDEREEQEAEKKNRKRKREETTTKTTSKSNQNFIEINSQSVGVDDLDSEEESKKRRKSDDEEDIIESFEDSEEKADCSSLDQQTSNKFVVHKTVYNYVKDQKNTITNPTITSTTGNTDENGDFYVTEDGEEPSVKVCSL